MSEFASRRMMMVDTQVRPSDVTKFPIIDAMLHVPREVYVPRDKLQAAYIGENVEIAPGRVVLEPRTLAKMLDALDIQPGEMVLDLGCGLGYSFQEPGRCAGCYNRAFNGPLWPMDDPGHRSQVVEPRNFHAEYSIFSLARFHTRRGRRRAPGRRCTRPS